MGKKYHPQDILVEDTSWSGQNAILFGETAQTLPKDVYNEDDTIADTYDTMERELKREAITTFFADNFVDNMDENVRYGIESALTDALDYYGHPEPNFYDFSDDDVIEQAQKILDEYEFHINLDDYRA